MIELYENLSRKQADLCTLVLKASSIPYRLKRETGGWGIWVDERHYTAARHAMHQYFSENREKPPVEEIPGKPHAYAGIWMAMAIAVANTVVQAGPVRDIWSDYGASAARITSGEYYRTVTALMLHADPVHLVGNMAGFALFGTAVSQIAGWGMGTLLVLMTGILGNLVNAWMYESAHLSIGASTAVFGAIGILTGYQTIEKRRTGGRRSAVWLPLAGGLGLLAFLGSGGSDGSANVDLAAHLFGFITGIAAGVAYAVLRRPWEDAVQWICLGIAAGIIVMAWGWGYSIHH